MVELDLTEVAPPLNDNSAPRQRKVGSCLPPIPIRPDKLSVRNARTLWQEFALLNVTIPDVIITEVRPQFISRSLFDRHYRSLGLITENFARFF